MKAYKVFRKEKNGLVSWNPHIPSVFKKRYRRGVTNKPLGKSKFFVFGSKFKAEIFRAGSILLETWEVDVPKLEEISTIAHWSTNAENYHMLWSGEVLSCRTALPPEGSYVASSVKLVRKIS